MRLIDITEFFESLTDHESVSGILTKLSKQPTISAVPVVRCRECKHFNLITRECENELLSTDHEGGASYSLNFYDDDFCSYGERRNTYAE